MQTLKNKIFVWAHKGLGTACRKAAIAIVGFAVEHNFFGGGHDASLEEKAVTVISAFLLGLAEWLLFLWRTRNNKNIQRAASVKADGVIGDIQTPLIVKKVSAATNIHGGRPS